MIFTIGSWFFMAGDALSPLSTCMVLFFFSLLLVSHHFTMAMLDQSNSASTSSNNRDGAKKRNTMVVSSARTEKSKKHMMRGSDGKGLQLQGPKKKGSRAPRPPLQWKKRFFSADEHEVSSGPNPISNK